MDQCGLLEESLVVLLDTKVEPLGFWSRHIQDCTYNVCQKSNRALALGDAPLRILDGSEALLDPLITAIAVESTI